MWLQRFAVLLAAVGWLLTLDNAALAAERVALVVGNADYNEAAAKLKNPVNDAAAMAEMLRRLGFEVITGTDLNEASFYKRIEAFDKAARSAQVALFFYAGHGLQVDGRNYLAPVDLRLETRQDLRRHAIELGAVLEVMRSETNLVILDACRNNPLAGELARSLGLNRAVAASRGLARVESVSGTLIAYATEPGSVAADGAGRHSPYTAALLEHLETPGLSVQDLFTQVTASVLASTDERQKPWTHSSLSKIVRLVPGDDSQSTAAAPKPPAPVSGQTSERLTAEQLAAESLLWESVKDSEDSADIQAYLDRYPAGTYEVLARNRLKRLEGSAAPGAPVQEVPVVSLPSVSGPESVEAGLGLERSDRRLIQVGLSAEGFDPGPADGLFGRGTRGAIGRWQASRGEEGTGYLDVEAAKLLLASGRTLETQQKARQEEEERVRQAAVEAEQQRREQAAREQAQHEAQERARQEADDAAYARAKASGNVAAYQAYLNAHPSGRHIEEARRLSAEAAGLKKDWVRDAAESFSKALTCAQREKDRNARLSAFVYLAEAQAKAGYVQGALATAQKIGRDDTRAYTFGRIAQAQARAGNVNGALATAQKIGGEDAAHAAVLSAIAQARAEAGNLKDSTDFFSKALESAEKTRGYDYAWALSAIGVAQAKAGKVKDATVSLSMALTSAEKIMGKQRRNSAFSHIGIAQAKAGRLEDALATAQRLRNDGWGQSVYVAVVEAQADAADITGALATVRRIGNEHVTSAAFIAIAQAQAEAGNVQGALATVNNIPEWESGSRAKAFSAIGVGQAMAGNVQGAAGSFSKALAIAENDAIWCVLAFSDVALALARAASRVK